MRFFLFLIVVVAGALAGLALTERAVRPDSLFLASRFPPWEFSPHIGAADIDPYTRGRLFALGDLPLASGEGFSLFARQDESGAPLERRCRYTLASPFPAARFWTLAITDPSGKALANLAERHGFTSAEILRDAEGPFVVTIAPEPASGNWLPTGGREGSFVIALRFYETPLAATATRLDRRFLPRLSKQECLP